MTLGDISKAFNAQNVRLQLGSDEIITCYNINKSKSHPRSRVHTRAGAVDFYSFPLLQVTFDAVVTKTVFDALSALNTLDSRSNLPDGTFSIIGQNLGGSSADDILATFTAEVPELSDIAGEAGHYLIRCTLIIKNSTYVAS